MSGNEQKNYVELPAKGPDRIDLARLVDFQKVSPTNYVELSTSAADGIDNPKTENQKAFADQLQKAQKDDETLKNNPYAQDVIVKELQTKIDNDPTLKDADGNKIQELLKQGKYLEAIKVGFELISNAIFGSKEKKTELGFPKFRQLDEEVAKLDLTKKSLPELNSLQTYFEAKISNTESVKRKISYTYIVSAVKDQIEQRDAISPTRIEIIEKQLQVGSVVLLNKQNAGAGGTMLQSLSDEDVDMTHVIVITEMGPPIRFSHATEHKFTDKNKSGVETNVPLRDYLQGNLADIVVLTPDEAHRKKAIERAAHIQDDEKNGYSTTAAALGAIGMNDVQKKEGKFNCGTYVQTVLDLDGKDISVPGQFLSDKRLKPTYMTMVDMSGS